jgi:serine phosphatase RsbU (regulator of sigma subunit)
MKPLPEKPSGMSEESKRTVKLAPPWMLRRETFEISPVLNISLYLVLGGLLFVTTLLFTDVISRLMVRREGVPMNEKVPMAQIRKKRFGLRFKFSLLIVSLILILTIGISSILSIVSTENQRKALADQMMDKARLSLENMTNVAREGILNNDELLLLAVIAKTMENRDISYSSILDTGNRVIAHSDINKRGEVFNDEFSRRAQEADEILIEPDYDPDELAPLYVLASPVKFAETRLGTVQIGYSTESIFKTIDTARRENLYSALIVTGITILVGILGAVLMASITIKPIKVLAKGANIIGEGRLDYKIHIKARDEIGLLSDEFNRMTDRLLEYQRKMEEKAKLDEQLEIARKIQQDLIPQSGIENASVSIDGYYKAAAGVGGDYYDFIQIGSDQYGLIMSDVAGKGVPASLMMIMIRTVFKSLINSGMTEPSRLVTLMNDTLASDIQSDRFATLLFGVFSCKNRQFRYTNAGYGPLLVYKKRRNNCFLVNPPQGSVPIGVMPEVEYAEEKPIPLDAGDSLYLFTDGIHEARNGNEEEYGMNRLAGIIPSFAERNSREIAGAIIDDVSRFVGNAEQYDDMTLTVMKVR